MKKYIFLVTLLVIPFSSFAGDLDEKINKACLRHAVSLVAKLKTDVVGELSQEKSDQALQLATDSCQAYFKKEFSNETSESVAAASSVNKEEEEGVTDWLTEKILSDDVKRKKGNERLKNMKR